MESQYFLLDITKTGFDVPSCRYPIVRDNNMQTSNSNRHIFTMTRISQNV